MTVVEGIVDQTIAATQGQHQHGAVMRFLDYFNERMGVYAISRMTLYKWRMGGSADPRILTHALEVYPQDDPRHELALTLMLRSTKALE